ncbi:type II toxin-antitoxin system VapB family antitoxin [Streptomyces sp. NBC_01803]|uniref:type II toxin-antitoxin system VapB family antitoxin n=1 Tax=Streptomyces sp. NBC_01803 TaxID=2975946 RepID=UPI002DD8A8BE|nr:type II toxin-antitoxin system VapB family antitoxin [Streptomyces sp. NBC_01803]WSA46476.1 type II toxin-antitoxin system VapB family antitoxin [Streptomyces sp. NBC_01803]
MTRTVVDIDDELLAQAAEVFGTSTKVATVNAALEDAIKRRKRASFLGWLAEGGLPDLTGPVEDTNGAGQAA